MFEKIFAFIENTWSKFTPLFVMNEYEEGIVLRFGKFKRYAGPGLHIKIPFAESVMYDNVVPRTINLGMQTLTSEDDETVSISAIATVIISDIRKACLEVEGVDEAVVDSCYGSIGELVASSAWEDIISPDFPIKIGEKSNAIINNYGIEIIRIQLSDLSACKTYRLIT